MDSDTDTDAGTDGDGGTDARLRAYDSADGPTLWDLKERFERELGALGGEEKNEQYDRKLTEAYEQRYREWVDRCVERDPGCVIVAERGEEADAEGGNDPVEDGGIDDAGDEEGEELAGYAFVLPEGCSLIWDAAVLNELYVREAVRGTGVANALMDAALDHARGQDLPLERIVLDVDGGNDRAGAFYRRHGFEHWGGMVVRDL